MVRRFLLIYILLSIIPFLVLGLIASNVTDEAVTRELTHAAQVSLEETGTAVSRLGRDAREFSLDIASDAAVQAYLQEYFGAGDAGTRVKLAADMDAALAGRLKRSNMACRLYLLDPEISETLPGTGSVTVLPPAKAGQWMEEALSSPRFFFWSALSETGGAALRQTKTVYGTADWKPLPAVLAVDVSLEQLRDISQSRSYLTGNLYIVDEAGRILYPYYNYDALSPEILAGGEGTYALGERLALVTPVRDMPLRLIRVVDLASIRGRTRDQRRLILSIAVALMALSAAAAVWFTQRFTKPVVSLARHMKNKRPDLAAPVPAGREIGEIRTLYESYNGMVSALNDQIEENYVSRIREREAELRALQAQINPHFLYNTLDSINWLALRYRADDISSMVVALSDMLRLSLNQGKNEITVRDELRQVECYLYLQSIRFPGRFDVAYEIADDVRQKTVIKMLLQPLVENAIVHGFDGLEKPGRIIIRAWLQDRTVHLEAANNGHPVDLKAMEALLAGGEQKNRTGYGIQNVHERIRIRYGKQYGLRYRLDGEWTTACITLPDGEGETEPC